VRLRRQNGVCSHARNADTDSVKRVPENIVSASRIVVFLKSEALVNQLAVVAYGITPLSAPATKVTISNVPPFVCNDVITKELQRFGNIAGPARV